MTSNVVTMALQYNQTVTLMHNNIIDTIAIYSYLTTSPEITNRFLILVLPKHDFCNLFYIGYTTWMIL